MDYCPVTYSYYVISLQEYEFADGAYCAIGWDYFPW